MDEKTHPHGVLEEMEESPNKMEKSVEVGDIQQKCAASCVFKKRILADSCQPNNEDSPLKPTD